MRNTLVAVLALVPALFTPASFAAAPAAGTPVRISTGVVAPRLVKTAVVEEEQSIFSSNRRLDTLVTVAFTVDEKGVPTDLKIVEPADVVLNQEVVKAVSQYRYEPGTLNSVPTSMPVTLKVYVHRASF